MLGDDERSVAKASGLFGGASQLPIVIGPAIAGALVALIGAPAVLLVDGATVPLRVRLRAVVRARREACAGGRWPRGLLAGVRYLTRDRLLGPLALTVIVLDGAANALAVAVPLLAYTRYDSDPHVAGWIFTGFGVGAVIGFAARRQAARPLSAATARKLRDPARDAAALGGRRTRLVAGRLRGRRDVRPLRPADQRADDGAPDDAAACGAPREGDDGGAHGERDRRAARPAGRRTGLPAFGNAGVWIGIAGGMTAGAVLFVGAVLRGEGQAAPATVTTA